MRIAIPIWDGRVSPVMDSARQVLLVDYKDRQEADRTTLHLPDLNPMRKAAYLESQGVTVLLCGAVSRQMHMLLAQANIEVRGWLCGNVSDVLQAYIKGTLTPERFCLPGCRRGFAAGGGMRGCGRRRRRNADTREWEKK